MKGKTHLLPVSCPDIVKQVGVVVVVVVVIRVLAYMIPADQENTSTPHFDLVIVTVEGLLI